MIVKSLQILQALRKLDNIENHEDFTPCQGMLSLGRGRCDMKSTRFFIVTVVGNGSRLRGYCQSCGDKRLSEWQKLASPTRTFKEVSRDEAIVYSVLLT